MTLLTTLRRGALGLAMLAATLAASADEATIRKNLAERLPNLPKIDEVNKTPIPGVFEVRFGTDVFYSDEAGNHIIQGSIMDTRTRVDLTQVRIDKLTAIDFATLPLKDAVVVKQGTGARKLVIFADPNCGYCKRIERDLLAVKDVTIYTFLYPILGPDSNVKSRDIWCAKDPAKSWRNWMVDGNAPAKVSGECDSAALDRNLKLGQKHKVNGTPAVVFEDGSRAPGALPTAQIEARLASAAKK
ncbi:DsbC family protein [Ideonella sp. A 288]|uniref:DsbC family protein n=1 Tax=Ideonella sp. A 288 TaxID=1962181 RepID=UPI0018FEB055|nr:DsbC family protein [Ideonella sp. A 288]